MAFYYSVPWGGDTHAVPKLRYCLRREGYYLLHVLVCKNTLPGSGMQHHDDIQVTLF